MTVKEYCDIAGISKSAVSYRISNNLLLPGIKSYEKVDRVYVLTPDTKLKVETIKQSFRTR